MTNKISLLFIGAAGLCLAGCPDSGPGSGGGSL